MRYIYDEGKHLDKSVESNVYLVQALDSQFSLIFYASHKQLMQLSVRERTDREREVSQLFIDFNCFSFILNVLMLYNRFHCLHSNQYNKKYITYKQ